MRVSGELSADEAQALAWLADSGLPVLLNELGYQEPPPVQELIDETVAAAIAVVEGQLEPATADLDAELARSQLVAFCIRFRRLFTVEDPRTPPSLARRVLRRADQEADTVLSIFAAVLVPAAAEALLPDASVLAALTTGACGVLATRLVAWRGRVEHARSAGAAATAIGEAREHAAYAAAQLVASAKAVMADDTTRNRDVAVAHAWVADQAIRELALADVEDLHGWHGVLAPASLAAQELRYLLANNGPNAELLAPCAKLSTLPEALTP